jgi:uncharacterized protein
MTLQYNLAQLLKSEVGATRIYDFESDEPINLEDGTATDIRGHVKFTLTNFGIIADVEARALLHLTCARCLEPFDTPTSVQFEDEYQPVIDIATGLPSTAPRSDTAFIISQSHTVDLTEALRQNLLLAVELIPVCREDCCGLCPTCGINRNSDSCDCHARDETSPFAVLQSLLSDANDQ